MAHLQGWAAHRRRATSGATAPARRLELEQAGCVIRLSRISLRMAVRRQLSRAVVVAVGGPGPASHVDPGCSPLPERVRLCSDVRRQGASGLTGRRPACI